MKKRFKKSALESHKSRYGRLFVLPWEIGFILFFLLPLIRSIKYSFSKVYFSAEGFITEFNGLTNYIFAWYEQTNFTENLQQSIIDFTWSLPIIIILSLVLALILNQKFRGRMLVRSVFFLPVIIATGVVIQILSQDMIASQLRESGSSADFYIYNASNFGALLYRLGLPDTLITPIVSYINQIFDLLWNSGVQIILFIAGLQSIPDQLYEVASVEGATPWEKFWFVTFPLLSGVIILNIIFTSIYLLTNSINPVMVQVYEMILRQNYDVTSAMMWIYFIVIGIIIEIILTLFNKLLQRKWD